MSLPLTRRIARAALLVAAGAAPLAGAAGAASAAAPTAPAGLAGTGQAANKVIQETDETALRGTARTAGQTVRSTGESAYSAGRIIPAEQSGHATGRLVRSGSQTTEAAGDNLRAVGKETSPIAHHTVEGTASATENTATNLFTGAMADRAAPADTIALDLVDRGLSRNLPTGLVDETGSDLTNRAKGGSGQSLLGGQNLLDGLLGDQKQPATQKQPTTQKQPASQKQAQGRPTAQKQPTTQNQAQSGPQGVFGDQGLLGGQNLLG